MKGVSDLITQKYMSDKPVVKFDERGGSIGRLVSNPVTNVKTRGGGVQKDDIIETRHSKNI